MTHEEIATVLGERTAMSQPEARSVHRSVALPAVAVRVLFFATLFVYLACVGAVGQPPVHPFYDEVMVRDCGTVWHSLTWHLADTKHFLPVAVMRHMEGPLQFLVLNLYCHLVGDLVPLNPATLQFPNTVFACLGALCAYLLGRRLHSERLGRLSALTFALMPWLAVTIRRPEIFCTMSVLLEFAVLLCYAGFVMEPARRLYRLAAPLFLALYLTTALDWPAFLPILAIFLALNKRLSAALRNRANLVPLGVAAIHIMWTSALFYYGASVSPRHARIYLETLVFRSFVKAGGPDGFFPLKAFGNAWYSFGLLFPLALLGVVLFLLSLRDAPESPSGSHGSLQKTGVLSMGAWLVGASMPLFKVSGSSLYGYVLGVPIAMLAALCLLRVKTVPVLVLGLLMVGLQWHLIMQNRWFRNDDRRVLAAATFLIERRPDLLEPGKTALLPRDEASNVGQYARGRNERIIMPADFPVEKFLHSVGSDEDVLRHFVDAYETRRAIHADWLLLSSELLSGTAKASAFYQRLLADPQISWIAKFEDRKGRVLWLGEVKPGGTPLERVTVYPIDPLADRYTATYDRISFLKQHVTDVIHTFP